MIKTLSKWISLNENLNFSQLALSQDLLFLLQDKFNITNSISFNSLTQVKTKADLDRYVKENNINLLFGISQGSPQYLFIFKQPKATEDIYELILFDNEKIAVDQTDSFFNIKKLITQKYTWYSTNVSYIWNDKNTDDIKNNLQYLSNWFLDFFNRFEVLLRENYDKNKELVRNHINLLIPNFNLDEIKKYEEIFLSIKNQKEDNNIYNKLNIKGTFFFYFISWLQKNYTQYKYNKSVSYLGMLLAKIIFAFA